MGVVTPEMLKGMQDATLPMVASFMDATPKAKRFWKPFSRLSDADPQDGGAAPRPGRGAAREEGPVRAS